MQKGLLGSQTFYPAAITTNLSVVVITIQTHFASIKIMIWHSHSLTGKRPPWNEWITRYQLYDTQ